MGMKPRISFNDLTRRPWAFLTGLWMGMAGCTVGPDYEPPVMDSPTAFHAPTAAVEQGVPTALGEWWRVFDDAELDRLIQRVRSNNLDLRAARARVREARGMRGVTKAGYFPQLDAGASYSRSRLSENTLFGGAISEFGQPLEYDLYHGAFDMSWELDIFGGRRRANEAAQAVVEATHNAGYDVLISILAETGVNYFEIRSAQRRLAVARDSLEIREDMLDLMRDRFTAGIVGEREVTRQQAAVGEAQARIAPLEEQAQRALHRLSVLVGQAPNPLHNQLTPPGEWPDLAPGVPVGLPSDLLRQRPDLRRAERELAAATARIGAATANLYPRFFLTGAAGLQSIDAGDFFAGGSRYWSLGPSLRWPVFTAGRIRQEIHVQNARQEQAAIRYEQAFLTALEEAENALVAFGKEQDHYRALKEVESARRRSLELARQLYDAGLAARLDVLEAELSRRAAELNRLESEAVLRQDLVRLYKALGGGWQTPENNAENSLQAGIGDGSATRLSGYEPNDDDVRGNEKPRE